MSPDDERLATGVGAVALALLAAAIAALVWVSGAPPWGAHVRVAVYFHAVTGLREGAPVVIGGRTIGVVEAIALAPAGAPTPLGGEEGVAVTVAIAADDARRVARGGDVFLASRGAFADRYLEFGPSPTPTAPALAEGDQIRGSDPPSLDRVLQRTWDNLQVSGRFLDEIRPELAALRREVAAAATTLRDIPGTAPLRADALALVSEAERTYAVELGGEPGLARLRAVTADARATVGALRVTLADLGGRVAALRAGLRSAGARVDDRGAAVLARLDDALARAQAALARVDPLLASAAELADRLARGEGTIGKLMHDPEFPEDAKDLGKILKRQPWRIIGHPDDRAPLQDQP